MGPSLCFSIAIIVSLLYSTSIDTVDLEYQGQNITCNNTEPCTIRCDQKHACLNTVIYCPSEADCTITCAALYACEGFTVYCSQSNMCSINCNAERSCKDMNLHEPNNPLLLSLSWPGISSLYGVKYPIYPLDDYQNYTLHCNSHGKCGGMNLICPKYAHCDVTCTATTACSNIDVEWPLIPGFGSLFCDPRSSLTSVCWYANFPEPNPYKPYSLQCGAASACVFADIICPTNASCNVTCAGGSCSFANIQCPIYGNCSVTCVDCYSLSILWSSVVSSMSTLKCDNCDGVPTPPTLAPTANPTVVTSSPTLATYSPSLHPTISTLSPTENPTKRPTLSPTYQISTTSQTSATPTFPSIVPSNAPQIVSTSDVNNVLDTLFSTTWLLYVVIAVVIVISCGVCVLFVLACLVTIKRIKGNEDREVIIVQQIYNTGIQMGANSHMDHIVPDINTIPTIPTVQEVPGAMRQFTLSSTNAGEQAEGIMMVRYPSTPRDGRTMELGKRNENKRNISEMNQVAEYNDMDEDEVEDTQYGKCTQMGCACDEYIKAPSKWSKNQCKTCNHRENQHQVFCDLDAHTAGYIE